MRVVTEFVLRIPEGWAGRIAEAVAALTTAGAEVSRVVPERRVLAGVIESWFLGNLSQLPCANGIVEGASYVVDADGRHIRRLGGPGRATAMGPWDNAALDDDRLGKGPSRPGHWRRGASARPVDLLDVVQEDETPTPNRPYVMAGIANHCDIAELLDRPTPRDGISEKRVLEIPWRVRIGYSLVAILALCLILPAAQFQAHWGYARLAQVGAGALLFSLSLTAALGLCRHRLVRQACTLLGLLLTLLLCFLWDDVALAGIVPAFVAFLTAGITDESC